MKRTMIGTVALASLLAACSDSGDSGPTSTASGVSATTEPVSSSTDAPSTTEETTTTVAVTSLSGDPEVNFTSPDFGFEAYFPDDPYFREGSSRQWTEVEYEDYSYFGVGAAPYATVLTADDIEKLKILAEYTAETSYEAVITSSVASERDGHPGQQVQAETATDLIWVSVYADGNWMYSVITVIPKDAYYTAVDAEFFQDHFRIVGQTT